MRRTHKKTSHEKEVASLLKFYFKDISVGDHLKYAKKGYRPGNPFIRIQF